MPNRILKESITTSCEVDNLSADEERFFYRLIVVCDDFGRMDARPRILRAKCFPLKVDEISDSDVANWLQGLVDSGLVITYIVDGKPYLQVATFEKHNTRRAQHSKYPDMQADANICKQVHANVSETRDTRHETRDTRSERREEAAAAPENLSPHEKDCLNTLRAVENYPFDFAKDLDMLRIFMLDYPEIDILTELKKWRDYKRDKPLIKNKSSPRAQLRNWMIHARKFMQERGDRSNGETRRGHAQSDPGDPAGKFREFVRS